MIIIRVTLFDSPEDDEFDGDIGIDDDEAPRIRLNFSFEPDTLISSPDDSKFIGAIPLDNKDVFHPNGFPASQSSVLNLSLNDDDNLDVHQKEIECGKTSHRDEKCAMKENRPEIPAINPFNRSPIKGNLSSSKSPNKRSKS